MSLSLRHLSQRLRRRLTLALAVAILFAGFAQAAHFHKDELSGRESQADTHCLLCLFAAGSAGPPASVALVRAPVRRFGNPTPVAVLFFDSTAAASYDARGPPTL